MPFSDVPAEVGRTHKNHKGGAVFSAKTHSPRYSQHQGEHRHARQRERERERGHKRGQQRELLDDEMAARTEDVVVTETATLRVNNPVHKVLSAFGAINSRSESVFKPTAPSVYIPPIVRKQEYVTESK